MDRIEFNTKLAKMLQGLKKEGLAIKVRQGYKGTGGQSARRQIWVDFNANVIKPLPGQDYTNYSSCTDVWLENGRVTIGGVVAFTAIDNRREIPSYAKNPFQNYTQESTPESVYAWIVEMLKTRT